MPRASPTSSTKPSSVAARGTRVASFPSWTMVDESFTREVIVPLFGDDPNQPNLSNGPDELFRGRCRRECPGDRLRGLRRLRRVLSGRRSGLRRRWYLHRRRNGDRRCLNDRQVDQWRVRIAADAEWPQVLCTEVENADDVRRERQHDVGLCRLFPIPREQPADDRYIAQAGNPFHERPLVVANQTREQVRFAVPQ